MKKVITMLMLISFTMLAFGQKKDTTKVQPLDTATYVLMGKIADYELLFAAVTRPGDVTRNQIEALAAWIRRIQALPTKKPK